VEKAEGRKPAVRPRCRWANDIKNVNEIWCEGVDRIRLSHDRDNRQANFIRWRLVAVSSKARTLVR
jgi:hypothetical protein